MQIKDVKLQEALFEQIFHYGQTPLQIFQKPHPQRQPLSFLKGKPKSPLFVDVKHINESLFYFVFFLENPKFSNSLGISSSNNLFVKKSKRIGIDS